MTPLMGNELLEGEYVRLNRVTSDDVPALAAMWDIEFTRNMTRRPAYPMTVESMREWFAYMQKGADEGTEYTFAVRALTDNRLIGSCALKDIRWAARQAFFWVGVSEPGHGFGSDAVRVLLRFAFMELNLFTVNLEVFSYNERAHRAYTKVGFQDDGCVRNFILRDGQYYDMMLMSITRDEWAARYLNK